jgi:hypothetical protein
MAKGASLVFIGALLAGCSMGPTGPSVASSGAASPTKVTTGHPTPDQMKGLLHRHMAKSDLLKLQAEGKIPASIPAKVLAWELKHQSAQRPVFDIKRHPAHPVLWASDTNNDYLVGQNSALTATVADINTGADGCYYPVTVKIDHSKNIWSTCEYGINFSEQGISPIEFSSTGTLLNTYNPGCNTSEFPYECELEFGYGFDQAENSSNVFGFDDFVEGYFCVSSSNCNFYDGAAFSIWPNGSPSTTPTMILPSSIVGAPDQIYDGYYMDVDSSNNIYFDYYGCAEVYPYTCGYGVDEIENATTSPTEIQVMAPGALSFAGGVVVSAGGSTLSVTDQDNRTICQLAMPVFAGETCSTLLGPTKQDFLGLGDPVSGDYNLAHNKLAQGDAYSWLDDTANVSGNIWKIKSGSSLIAPEGAAYTPSDR